MSVHGCEMNCEVYFQNKVFKLAFCHRLAVATIFLNVALAETLRS